MKRVRSLIAAVVLGMLGPIGVAACTPAQQAVVVNVANEVLKDLEAGMRLDQITQDVGNMLAGQPGVDVAEVLNDAFALLEDLHIIPANILGKEQAMHSALKAKLSARTDGGA